MRKTMVWGVIGCVALSCENRREQKVEPAPKSTATEPAPPAAPTPPPAPRKTGREVAEIYRQCMLPWSAHDTAKLAAWWTDQIVIEAVDSGNPPATGPRDEVIARAIGPMWSAFPDIKDEPRLIVVGDHGFASIDELAGTNTGELHGNAPTNKQALFYISHLFKIDDQAKIKETRAYGDVGTVMSQLGLAPPRPSIELGWKDVKVAVTEDSPVERLNLQAYDQMVAAFNAHDVPGFLALWTDDAVEKDYGSQRVATGKKTLEKGVKDFFAAFPDIQITASERFAGGDWVVSNAVLTGTNTGDIPAMKLKKTNKAVTLSYMELLRFEASKVKELHRFYNGMAFLAQLGLPPPKAPATPAKAPKTPKTK